MRLREDQARAARDRGDRGPWAALLRELAYLRAKAAAGEAAALCEELADVDDEASAWVLGALRRSLPALAWDPDGLAGQLGGRLDAAVPGLAGLLAAAAEAAPLWPLRPTLTRPDDPWVATLTGHDDWIGSLVVLPDGERIVSASEDGTMRVWSRSQRRCLKVIRPGSGPINTIAATPDGKRLIAGSDDRVVRVWDTRRWRCLHELHGHQAYVRRVVALGDGRAASAADEAPLRIWDLSDGTCLKVLAGHAEQVLGLAASRDGSRMVSASVDNVMIVWDTVAGAELRRLVDARSFVARVMGSYIAGQNLTGVGHLECPHALAFTPDGRLVSGSHDVRVWDVERGEERVCGPAQARTTDAIAVAPDGRTAAGVADGALTLWDLEAERAAVTLPVDGRRARAVAYTPDGAEIVTAGDDERALKLWRGAPGRRYAEHLAHASHVQRVELAGEVAVSAAGGVIMVWDRERGALRHRLDDCVGAWGQPFACSRDGSLLIAAAPAGPAWVWETATGRRLYELAAGTEAARWSPHSFAFAPDGRRALIGSMGADLRLWDLEAGHDVVLQGRTKQVGAVAFAGPALAITRAWMSPPKPDDWADEDWRWETNNNATHLQGWDLREKALRWTVAATKDAGLGPFVVSPDAARLAVLSGEDYGSLRVLAAASGADLTPAAVVDAGGIHGLRWDDDETLTLVAGRDAPTLQRWSLADGAPRCAERRALAVPRPLEAAFAGGRALVRSAEGVTLVDLRRAEVLARFAGDGEIREVTLSPDGETAVVGEHSGRVHLLRLRG
jgi:WD40 repeat protein